MGNYSRNTFDKTKNYTSVRLQQGVPLVDADWNEQTDILRQQTNDSLYLTLRQGGAPGDQDMQLDGAGLQNDFKFALIGYAGRLLVNGQLVQTKPITYSAQPWTNAQKAAADGVAVIPPLTTPGANGRTDCVYLDVWEREVNSIEDPNLVNSVIGVETAVRTKYEFAVRVNEGQPVPPAPPAGHSHMPMALLKRPGNAVIGTFDRDNMSSPVKDMRPVLPYPVGGGRLNVIPILRAVNNMAPWSQSWISGRIISDKNSSTQNAGGIVQVHLPQGARIWRVSVGGICPTGTCSLFLSRIDTSGTGGFPELDILSQTVVGPGNGFSVAFFTSWPLDPNDPNNRVDNWHYHYAFVANCNGLSLATIEKIFIDYFF